MMNEKETETAPTELALEAPLPPGWRLADLFGDEPVLTDGEQSVWVDRNGSLYLGDSEGEGAYGIPADLLPALCEMRTAIREETPEPRVAPNSQPTDARKGSEV